MAAEAGLQRWWQPESSHSEFHIRFFSLLCRPECLFPPRLCHPTDGVADRFMFVKRWHLSEGLCIHWGTAFPPSLSLHESDGGTAAQVTHLEFTEKPWQGSRLLAPCASLCCLAETWLCFMYMSFKSSWIPGRLVATSGKLMGGSKWRIKNKWLMAQKSCSSYSHSNVA